MTEDTDIIWTWDARGATDQDYANWEHFQEMMREYEKGAVAFVVVQTDSDWRQVREQLEKDGWQIGLGGSGAFERMFPWTRFQPNATD